MDVTFSHIFGGITSLDSPQSPALRPGKEQKCLSDLFESIFRGINTSKPHHTPHSF